MYCSMITFGVLLSCVTVTVEKPASDEFKGGFWVINDFHVNLSYNSADHPYGDVNYDPPLVLFAEAVKFCAQKNANPSFVLLLGDFVAHMPVDMANGFDILMNTMRETVRTVKQYFPSTKVYPVLGNHDQFPTRFIFNNSYYDDLLEKASWKELFGSEELVKEFRKGGYYSTDVFDNIRLVVLNSVVLMNDFQGKHNEIQTKQIDWFSTQLKEAAKANKKVFLVSHIPIGMGNNFDGEPVKFLDDTYNKRLLSVFSEMSKLGVVNFWGHQHTDQLKITNELTAFISPAVSPYHQGSNPSVRYCTFDRNGLVDYDQYTMDLELANRFKNVTWNNTYSFRRDYMSGTSKREMVRLAMRIATDPTLSAAYLSRVFSFIRQVTAPRKFLCMITSIRESQFSWCAERERKLQFADDRVQGRFLVITISICFVIFALMAMLFLNVCNRRNQARKHMTGNGGEKAFK